MVGLLRLITVMRLTAGTVLWFVFLAQLYEKLIHLDQKNLSGESFFLMGLVLVFFTGMAYLGYRSRRASPQPPADQPGGGN